MTPDQLTQAAAQRCADLANAEHLNGITPYDAACFNDGRWSDRVAFRREVEAKDAMIREVLALLDEMDDLYKCDGLAMSEIKAILRANLLPDPTPTLLEEFLEMNPVNPDWDRGPAFKEGARQALDWIAKRQENEG